MKVTGVELNHEAPNLWEDVVPEEQQEDQETVAVNLAALVPQIAVLSPMALVTAKSTKNEGVKRRAEATATAPAPSLPWARRPKAEVDASSSESDHNLFFSTDQAQGRLLQMLPARLVQVHNGILRVAHNVAQLDDAQTEALADLLDEGAHEGEALEIVTRNPDAIKETAKQIHELLDALDRLDDDDLTLDQLADLVLRIEALTHASNKRLTKQMGHAHKKAREENVKELVASYRSNVMYGLAFASGVLSALGGMAGMAPNQFRAAFEKYNTFVPTGLQASLQADNTAMSRAAHDLFTGYSQSVQMGQQVHNSSQQSAQQQSSSNMSAQQQNTVSTDTTVSEDGQKVQSMQQKRQELIDRENRAKQAALGQ